MSVFSCSYNFLQNGGQVLRQKVGKRGLVSDNDAVDSSGLGHLGRNSGAVRARNEHMNATKLLGRSYRAEGCSVERLVIVVCDDERRTEALEKGRAESRQLLPAQKHCIPIVFSE